MAKAQTVLEILAAAVVELVMNNQATTEATAVQELSLFAI
jgi:hypothetical protein